MSDLERKLRAALEARSAAVTPDPQAWPKHRAAALTEPDNSSRRWFGQRRVLPLLIAAAVALVAAVGTSIVVSNNRSSPAISPTQATTAAPATGSSRTVTSAASPTGSAVVNVPLPKCTGAPLGSAELTPAGVNGFIVRMQVRHTAGGEVLCAGITGAAGGTVQTSTGGTVAGAGPLDLAASSTWVRDPRFSSGERSMAASATYASPMPTERSPPYSSLHFRPTDGCLSLFCPPTPRKSPSPRRPLPETL